MFDLRLQKEWNNVPISVHNKKKYIFLYVKHQLRTAERTKMRFEQEWLGAIRIRKSSFVQKLWDVFPAIFWASFCL